MIMIYRLITPFTAQAKRYSTDSTLFNLHVLESCLCCTALHTLLPHGLYFKEIQGLASSDNAFVSGAEALFESALLPVRSWFIIILIVTSSSLERFAVPFGLDYMVVCLKHRLLVGNLRALKDRLLVGKSLPISCFSGESCLDGGEDDRHFVVRQFFGFSRNPVCIAVCSMSRWPGHNIHCIVHFASRAKPLLLLIAPRCEIIFGRARTSARILP